MSKEKEALTPKVVTRTLRIPSRVYQKLVAYQQENPHLSFNAIIVDLIDRLPPAKKAD